MVGRVAVTNNHKTREQPKKQSQEPQPPNQKDETKEKEKKHKYVTQICGEWCEQQSHTLLQKSTFLFDEYDSISFSFILFVVCWIYSLPVLNR